MSFAPSTMTRTTKGAPSGSCPSLSASDCVSTILLPAEIAQGDEPSKYHILCCAAHHARNASVVKGALSRLHELYEALTYEEIYLAADAHILVAVGEMCLAAMTDHPDDGDVRISGTSLMNLIGLGSVLEASAVGSSATTPLVSSADDMGPPPTLLPLWDEEDEG